MYLFSTHQLKFKNSTYMLKIYMANTPRLSEIKKDNRQFAPYRWINMTIFYTPTMTVLL